MPVSRESTACCLFNRLFLFFTMRWIFVVILIAIISCSSPSPQEKLQETLTGNWLIIAPDHHLNSGHQEVVYSKVQDSIVVLSGLKLITLSDNGTFLQVDSIGKHGKWGISPDNWIHIERGGPGFENFSVRFTGYDGGTLKLTEFVNVEDEQL